MGTAGSAAILDLTADNPAAPAVPNCNSPESFAGALWIAGDCTGEATGTGVFDPFLTLRTSGGTDEEEAGFNTMTQTYSGNTGYNFEAVFAAGNRTSEVLLSTVELINIDGTNYVQIAIDINEPATVPESYISLRDFDIFITDDPDLGYPGANNDYDPVNETFNYAGESKVYSLGDNVVHFDYNVAGSGQGRADASVLIDEQYFIDAGAGPNSYLVLYAVLGIDCDRQQDASCGDPLSFTADSDFEEFSIRSLGEGEECPPGNFNCPDPGIPGVPVPAGLPLMLTALGIGAYMRKRTRKSA